MCDLRQRNRAPAGRGQVSSSQVGDRVAFVGRLAQHDVDQPVVLTVLTDGDARQHRARSQCQPSAGDTERACLVLINPQAQYLDRLVPVVIDTSHVRIRTKHGLGFLGPGAHAGHVGPDNAKLHRVWHRWAIGQ
jgi:hypothetical protein